MKSEHPWLGGQPLQRLDPFAQPAIDFSLLLLHRVQLAPEVVYRVGDGGLDVVGVVKRPMDARVNDVGVLENPVLEVLLVVPRELAEAEVQNRLSPHKLKTRPRKQRIASLSVKFHIGLFN